MSWRVAPFELGCAPSDSKYFAAWRAFFESFAPIERRLVPAYRHLLRPRFDAVQGGEDSGRNEELQSMAFAAASSVLFLGVSSDELGELLRAYVNGIPASAVCAIGARRDLAGVRGGLQPLGVIAGMAFARVTRASASARLSWFQSLDWLRASRMLCGLVPMPPTVKSAGDTVAGFEKVVTLEAFGEQYGKAPVRPGDKSRVWGGQLVYKVAGVRRSASESARNSRGRVVTAHWKWRCTGRGRTGVCGWR